MENTSLQNEGGRGRRYKEEEWIVPTSPSKPPALQNMLLELQNVQDPFPLAKIEEKGSTCHISESGA